MKKYNVIYSDPPWSYDNKKTGGSLTSGAAQQYETMNNKAIAEMNIQPICEKDAVLFLWATVPLMPEAFVTLSAWGFTYKTMLTWKKTGLGLGYWYRGQCEHLLVGVRGKVKPFRMQRVNFYEAKAGKHSAKPDYFRQLISESVQKSFDEPKKLEMFARGEGNFDGWDVYGNQVNNSITLSL